MTGFELEVNIKFVNKDSNLVMPRDKTTGEADCRFIISSARTKAGEVSSLSHGLASNQTCSWEFQVTSSNTSSCRATTEINTRLNFDKLIIGSIRRYKTLEL